MLVPQRRKGYDVVFRIPIYPLEFSKRVEVFDTQGIFFTIFHPIKQGTKGKFPSVGPFPSINQRAQYSQLTPVTIPVPPILTHRPQVEGKTLLLPRKHFTGCHKDGKDEYVFINYSTDYGTWADDVPLWVIEIDVVSDVRDEAAGIPEDFELLQNYPNPFNPTTTIPYRLASRAHVRLDVFNIYGQHVTSIVNAERAPGYYRATWNADVPSGTYFYRLTVEPLDGSGTAFEDVKKMVLVR